jgi:hypothetical protein
MAAAQILKGPLSDRGCTRSGYYARGMMGMLWAVGVLQGQSLICDPRPSLANQSWVDARIRKSGNQNNKNRNTQLRSKLVWFIDQWKVVGGLALERLRGSHNEQSVGPCWRHVGVVVLPLNSQAIVTLVMCCWMYSMHSPRSGGVVGVHKSINQ